ncbi:MAG TPA: polynucleotide adenylyltransferase [Spirochaetia bacterium]|nr:polynucleotide adenylyltransferase [Spirochaetia bacterium]
MIKNAMRIIEKLNNSGFEAYLCGGAVRDIVMNNIPKDYDITTSATPNEIIKVFNDFLIIPTGIKHGTITVMIENIPYEITTFRKDGKYSDGRRPDSVEYTTSLLDDLSRRDITINAMASNGSEIIDPYNGRQDIEDKLICCVGNPNNRITEDALRMLRIIRFASKYKFAIESKTFDAIKNNGYLLSNIAKERIRDEFNKIIMNDFGLDMLVYSRLMEYIYPEFLKLFSVEQNNPYHIYDVGNHSLMSVLYSGKKDLRVHLALFLHDMGKIETRTIDENGIDHFKYHAKYSVTKAQEFLMKYKYDNKTREDVLTLIKYHDIEFIPEKKYVKRMLNNIGQELLVLLCDVKIGDISAQNPDLFEQRKNEVLKFLEIINEVIEEESCFQIKDLAVNGYDMIELGLQREEIGTALNKLLEVVINEVVENDKEKLKEYLIKYIENIYY